MSKIEAPGSHPKRHPLKVLGGGEASGPLFPPPEINESVFSCEAYRALGLSLEIRGLAIWLGRLGRTIFLWVA